MVWPKHGELVITRIFVDNFRTLVNFEWKPGKLALLLGENGSGKSSVVDALWGIRAFFAHQGELRRWFPAVSRAQDFDGAMRATQALKEALDGFKACGAEARTTGHLR